MGLRPTARFALIRASRTIAPRAPPFHATRDELWPPPNQVGPRGQSRDRGAVGSRQPRGEGGQATRVVDVAVTRRGRGATPWSSTATSFSCIAAPTRPCSPPVGTLRTWRTEDQAGAPPR